MTVRRRAYGNGSSNDLLERLRSGQLTKAEVQQLIMNQSHLNQQLSHKTITSSSVQSPSSMAPSMSTGGKIDAMGAHHHHQPLPTVTSTVGTKTNPLYMKRQTSFKEFIFSLFPFLFIFWMLGGFDIVRNRKPGGVAGGMFGSNYSEWDEEDWEDDEDDSDSDTDSELSMQQKEELKHKKEADAAKKKQQEEEETDRRKAFFKKLGIDLSTGDGKDEDGSEDASTNQLSVNGTNKQQRKKRKRVRFNNVCGNEEAKMDLQDLVDYLKNPQKYQVMGCKLPKGVLMAGPPGTGKTLLARALAGEAGVPFLATNGASFDEIFVGVGVMRVRKLFERAKERAPCIVFIDEIDAIANTRMQMGTAHSSDSLNALLSEMDGFEQNTGIIVIAATNMPDRLDAALIRPGRFDRKVHLQLPDRKAREHIVRLYLGERGDDTIDIPLLVGDISGFSGAELESMVNLASIECVKAGANKVSQKHLIEAKEVISMGRARTNLDVGIKTRTVTAYHEGGHAIVSLYTKGAKPVYKATILPRGSALGFVASVNEDEFMATKESLLAQLDVCMGGRAAEELYSGSAQITTGASSDFNQATRIATAMVCQYGMSSKVGRVYYSTDDINKLSPELQNVINQEVRRLLDESYHRAKHIIVEHENAWKMLANGLLEKETLNGDEIRTMIAWDESQQIEPVDSILSEKENGASSNSNGGGRRKQRSLALKTNSGKKSNSARTAAPMVEVQASDVVLEDTLKQNGAELLNPNPTV
eukprot:CAMPEP_0202697550 /NCGR_PEP_ID=MMETSP1385-20130828/10896_1 /ASSEMBLY_ACC=CAM_ASM_000861 /TAXON_ID=933848 /ORGANISM="Elphidium margaritaceum" /LENGTH=755 /DNA_ID=CAMNT_0049354047 /DNA_START=274 /DNA_END=2541 /DNA_ORIENTATION=-